LVPIIAGTAGLVLGPAMVTTIAEADRDLDSHFRYLSGLLLGIGLAYLSGIPGIERRRSHFLFLGGIVVLGGLGRLCSLLAEGAPSPAMFGALILELLVTPAITLWQLWISARTP
jgi:hypothetical protein